MPSRPLRLLWSDHATIRGIARYQGVLAHTHYSQLAAAHARAASLFMPALPHHTPDLQRDET